MMDPNRYLEEVCYQEQRQPLVSREGVQVRHRVFSRERLASGCIVYRLQAGYSGIPREAVAQPNPETA